MNKEEKYKKAINELADSYELHLKQWAKRCIDTINEYTTNLQQENKKLSEQLELLTSKLDEYDLIVDERNQLKKQLEETEKCLKDMYHINIENDKELEKTKTQQKEFIKFLEDNYKETQDIWYIKILQKYKETIGGK